MSDLAIRVENPCPERSRRISKVYHIGAATETPPDSGRWVYKATKAVSTGTSVRIAVTATDRPGHTGVKIVSG